MGILATAKPIVVVCTRNRARATAFYRDTLGLQSVSEDNFAAVFETGGITLRISFVADFTPHGHTMLGFKVADVEATVKALSEKGVSFMELPHIKQNQLGIWTAPGGEVQVAWLRDPDSNVLSITNA